ncbi:MAG: alpha amylase C-terminal domain-containing protein [Candidatus Gastranaerophilales bacterium]|nr:alpha amylase C-terminal domain-containing protein [Candidatus Gastranaerophilales bacterium]
MKVSNVANAKSVNYNTPKLKKEAKNSTNYTNSTQLSNIYYTPLNFTRRWSEHKSWGAQIDPGTKDVTFKLFSFPDNKSVSVAVTDQNTGETNTFPMTQKNNDGVFESEIIPSTYAKHGDTYSYIIEKANGDTEKVKDPYSYRQNTLMGESVLYDNSLFKWGDSYWYEINSERVSRVASGNNGLTPVSDLKIYELNTKTFTSKGDFEGVKQQLAKIKALGFNAIELMPVEATYSYNWGYDGVDKFAPSEHLGGPDDLKDLINQAHILGLNVIMDMVPNHIGPDGNSLGKTGPYVKGPNAFGDAFNYEGENSRYVRDFIVNSALNWIENYHCDGLRLDMTKYMESDYTMKQIAAEVNYHKPDAFLIAEDARSNIQVNKEGDFWESRVLHDRRVINPLEPWEYGGSITNEDAHIGAIEEISDSAPSVKLGRLGFDSEWDFIYFHQLKEALYGNIDMNTLLRAMAESQNRVKYIMSHDEIGNFDGTRLVSKLMVPMLSMNDNIILSEEDYSRASEMSDLKHQSYEDSINTVKNQKSQLVCEKLVKMFLTGQFDKYKREDSEYYWLEPVQPEFVEEVLKPLGINEDSGICPEKIKEMYLKSFGLCKTALASTYAVPGPKMVFQGDENLDVTPFRFFREFQSLENDQRNLSIEKGYNAGKKGMEESTLGNIQYSPYGKNKLNQYEQLTIDLNKLAMENPAMNSGYYLAGDTIKHTQSKVLATHSVSDKMNNELFTISNFDNSAYPRQDADRYYIKFPKGTWVEVLNTDNKKYGGVGYINKKPIVADGENNTPINLGRYSTAIFKKIA